MAEHYLVVVGRAESKRDFFEEINPLIKELFKVEGIHSLDEYSEVDNKDRFIIFASSEEDGRQFKDESEALIHRLQTNSYGAAIFDGLSEAIMYAEEKYEFETDDAKRQERRSERLKKFPPFNAEELEQFHIFDSLYHTGKVVPMRARYNEEEVVILAHITFGADEVRVTPMMILINDEIHEELEIPFH